MESIRTRPEPRILAFAGSCRASSYNRCLVRITARFIEESGGRVTVAELIDYNMPLMNEDLEAGSGIPEKAGAFKRLLSEHDGFLIASPEYNGSITPLLKNVLDWASRQESREEEPLSAFRGKTAALVSASPGSLGGLRSLMALRQVLGNLGVLVIPAQHAVPGAQEAFVGDAELAGSRNATSLRRVAGELVRTTSALIPEFRRA